MPLTRFTDRAAHAVNTRYTYTGDAALAAPIAAALARVVDPELALSVADLGLVYAVAVDAAAVRVRMTMTTPACPVADLVVDDVRHEVGAAAGRPVEVELVWDPPWTAERLSETARRFMA